MMLLPLWLNLETAAAPSTDARLLTALLQGRKPLLGQLPGEHWVNDGQIGSWVLNEGDGKIYDSSKRGHTGTLGAGNTWGTGKYGSEIVNASTTRIDIDSVAPYVNKSEGTMVLALKMDAAETTDGSGHGIFEIGVSGDGSDMIGIRKLSNDTLTGRYRVATANSELAFPTIADFSDTYQIIAYTWDPTNLKIYQGGELVGSMSSPTAISVSLTLASLASDAQNSPSLFFGGSIAFARLHTRALHANEIKALFIDPWPEYAVANWMGPYTAPVGGNAPTGTIYGPLYGPFRGVL